VHPLTRFLQSLAAECGGWIPFERYMAEALYHPEFGYYTAHIPTVGRRGDFSTAATLSGALGRSIAAWTREQGDRVIELGAGDGSLAEAILKERMAWKWGRQPRLRHYHIVEISPVLRERQQARLARWKDRVKWHAKIVDALAACEGEAAIFSNELVDAFPVRWLRWEGTRWEEIGLRFDPSTGLAEEFRPVEIAELPGGNFPVGQRVEWAESYRQWLGSWASSWTGGAMLTIDYGAETWAEIYHRRREGTLRGYYRQQRVEGAEIYLRFGKQDLTADVCFQAARIWGEALGWRTARSGNLAGWLQSHGADAAMLEAAGSFRFLEQRA